MTSGAQKPVAADPRPIVAVNMLADLLAGESLEPTLARARAAGHRSPEEIRGERRDRRSDVFVLGCVLHERLTGNAPFTRATARQRNAAILTEDPPDLAD